MGFEQGLCALLGSSKWARCLSGMRRSLAVQRMLNARLQLTFCGTDSPVGGRCWRIVLISLGLASERVVHCITALAARGNSSSFTFGCLGAPKKGCGGFDTKRTQALLFRPFLACDVARLKLCPTYTSHQLCPLGEES